MDKKQLTLLVEYKGKKTLYVIDNPKSLKIMYNLMEDSYLISFKQYHKEMLVSTRHFNVMGKMDVKEW